MNACKPAPRWTLNVLAAVASAILFVPVTTLALTPGTNDGYSQVGTPNSGNYCMQNVYGGGNITSSNLLNCTANDVSISKATEFCVTHSDGTSECGHSPPLSGEPAVQCATNEQIILTAKFAVSVTSSSRFDESFYFRVDGGDSARGSGAVGGTVGGQCSMTNLIAPGATAPDGTIYGGNPDIVTEAKAGDRDTCGDLLQGPRFVTFTLPMSCVGDSNNRLKLPNCTSWHSNASTKCELGGATGDSAPETKSKCNCDDGFTLEIFVAPPNGAVLKQAIDAIVKYQVTVSNTGANPITVNSLTDAVNSGTPAALTDCLDSSNNTLVGQTVAAGGEKSCTYSRTVGDTGGVNYPNTVKAHLVDNTTGKSVDRDNTANVFISLTGI